jgi:heme-degrading monooxygenase HmoA
MKLWHLDADCFGPLSSKSLLQAKAISLNRHFVPKEKKGGFEKKFEEVRGLLEEYTKPYPVIGGWRIEKETVEGKERDEWNLFSGFDSVEHHMAFAKTKAFEKYREIVGCVEGFEVRHLKAIEGL